MGFPLRVIRSAVRIFSLLVTLSLSVIGAAQSAIPERVLLNSHEDLSRNAVVSWRTEATVEKSLGQISVASADPRFVKTAREVVGTSQTVVLSNGNKAQYHRVRFEGLTPGTAYSYRVGDGKTWSEWIDFRTAQAVSEAEKVQPFSFIYFGDAQNDVKSLWSRAIRNSYRELPKTDLLVHAGDLINVANNDNEWADWFYAGSFIHGSIPCLAVPGNHEYAKVGDARAISTFWKPQFAQPSNGLAGLEGSNFAINYQGALFIALNSNERIEEQTKWLESTLSKSKARWIFATFHHPVYSTAKNRDNPEIRKQWQPLFQKYNVALVLQGHDHTYGRFNVPTGLTAQDKGSGTVYVVSVSGPKMYELGETAEKDMDKVANWTQLFQIIRVTHDKVRFEAYKITGELFDAFELTKNRNGSNRFVKVKVPSSR